MHHSWLHMKTYDPIEAFMLGFLFGPARTILGLTAIVGIFASCAGVGGHFAGSAEDVAMIFFSIFFMLMAWCNFGTWALVGMVGCLAMCEGLYAFVVTDSPKTWFYVTATGVH